MDNKTDKYDIIIEILDKEIAKYLASKGGKKSKRKLTKKETRNLAKKHWEKD